MNFLVKRLFVKVIFHRLTTLYYLMSDVRHYYIHIDIVVCFIFIHQMLTNSHQNYFQITIQSYLLNGPARGQQLWIQLVQTIKCPIGYFSQIFIGLVSQTYRTGLVASQHWAEYMQILLDDIRNGSIWFTHCQHHYGVCTLKQSFIVLRDIR